MVFLEGPIPFFPRFSIVSQHVPRVSEYCSIGQFTFRSFVLRFLFLFALPAPGIMPGNGPPGMGGKPPGGGGNPPGGGGSVVSDIVKTGANNTS